MHPIHAATACHAKGRFGVLLGRVVVEPRAGS
jgi:hypothetical protein